MKFPIYKLIYFLFISIFIHSCSSNDNRFLLSHFNNIQSNSNNWIDEMQKEDHKPSIDQANLKEDFLYYNMKMTDQYREFSLLKHHYKLETSLKGIKILLSEKSDLTRRFYSCDGNPVSKVDLSKMINNETKINAFLSEELEKIK